MLTTLALFKGQLKLPAVTGMIPDIEVARTVFERLDAAVPGSNSLAGKRVALGASSRGIGMKSGRFLYTDAIRGTADWVRSRGGTPIIFPAMGSHGGATAEGQAEVLRHWGLHEIAEIVSYMDTVCLGEVAGGVPVHISRTAHEADFFIPVNRVKAHTEWIEGFSSGVRKMLGIGFGKLAGAGGYHQIALARSGGVGYQFGVEFSAILNAVARRMLETSKLLAGVALVEDATHSFAAIEALTGDTLFIREPELLKFSNGLLPRLPVNDLQVLLLGRMGKDVSGAGLDPNFHGRFYPGMPIPAGLSFPNVHRIYVRRLSEATGLNAIGLGYTDGVHHSIIDTMMRDNGYTTRVNSETGGRPEMCLPPRFIAQSDYAIFWQAEAEFGREPELLYFRDTLNVGTFYASGGARRKLLEAGVELDKTPIPLRFDGDGNLLAPTFVH